MQDEGSAFSDELREIIFATRGAIQRLAHVLDGIGDQLGTDGDQFPDWMDEAGRLSVWAREIEEVPRLLVRIAHYLRRVREAGVSVHAVQLGVVDSDWADVVADLVLDGTDFPGGAFAGPEPARVTPTIRDLRNAIEHHSDYLAGDGRKPELVRDLQEPITYRFVVDPFELHEIHLFGQEYEVGAAIETVIMLAPRLNALVGEE